MPEANLKEDLSIRNTEIMSLFCAGVSRKGIAEELGLNYKEVVAIVNTRLKIIKAMYIAKPKSRLKLRVSYE